MKRFALLPGVLLAFLLGCGVASAQQYIVSTVAGTGTSPGWSGDSGPALSAQFTNPLRVAVDAQGNLYITDYSNYSVRKVTKSTGIIKTLAGNGSLGFSGDGSPGDGGSQLSNILDVVVDSSGVVYIADSLNSRVRRVDLNGIITTYAGNGSRGFAGDGGQATDATLYFPSGLTLDSAGNLYIADYGNATVRKVNKLTGVITTVAGVGYSVFGAAPGDGSLATKAFLELPYSLGMDGAGNLYIGDIGTGSIRKVGSDGKISTYISNFLAQNFAMDASGTIYYTDQKTNTVRKILPGGSRLVIGGNGTSGWDGDGGPASAARFNLPYGVAVDSNGNVYVADAGNAVIRRLSPVPFSIGAVANAANLQVFAPPVSGSGDSSVAIAPGEIVVLFGSGIGPANLVVATPSGGFFPTNVGGTQVTINGAPAPLIYASSTVVAAVVPYSVYGLNSTQAFVTYQGKSSAVATFSVAPTAPGIFTSNSSGSGQAAVRNQNGTLNGVNNPAPLGSVITLYATGEGQTSPAGIDGKLAGISNLPSPLQPLKVTIGGLTAVVDYFGAAPTQVAGVMQLNVEVPSGLPTDSAVPVVLQIGGVNSPTVTIAVTNQQ